MRVAADALADLNAIAPGPQTGGKRSHADEWPEATADWRRRSGRDGGTSLGFHRGRS